LQLDKTRIVIRERGFLEILDLSLGILREYPAPLLLAFTLGTIPFAVLNYVLLGSLDDFDPYLAFPRNIPLGFVFWMLILVTLEIPLATAPATLLLGKVTFLQQPGARAIAREMFSSLWQLLLYQIVLRGFLILTIVTAFLPYCLWPYLNEVILLERNPTTSGGGSRMTTMRRSSALHGGSFGELLGRALASALIAAILVAVIWSTCIIVDGLLRSTSAPVPLDEQAWTGRISYTVYYPIALWVVVHFFSVVRFLSYLDLRIRREAWEVELKLRAESARLARQPT